MVYAIIKRLYMTRLVKYMKLEQIPGILAQELRIAPHQANATISLLDDGNTVPFIARYRKEATGELDEEQIRLIEERLAYLRNLAKRQEEILASIEEQQKLTPELQAAIEKTTKLQELEDLYLPYRPKRRKSPAKKVSSLWPICCASFLPEKALTKRPLLCWLRCRILKRQKKR